MENKKAVFLSPFQCNSDLKHQDGRRDDGVPEVYFDFRSCAQRTYDVAVRRPARVDDGKLSVLAYRLRRCDVRDFNPFLITVKGAFWSQKLQNESPGIWSS